MMKTLFTTIMLMLFVVSLGNAQDAKPKKSAKYTIEVNGVCGMCKKRIETAAIKTKGVKYANWNVDTHLLSVIIDERKTNVQLVQQSVANVGHDTADVRAQDEVYDGIHTCCKYREDNTNDDIEN